MDSIQHRILTTPDTVRTMTIDRETGHHMVMQMFPHTDGPARAQWNVLWTTLPEQDTVLVRTTRLDEPLLPSWVKQHDSTRLVPREKGDTVSITVELAALKTPATPVDPAVHAAVKQGADGTPRKPGHGLAYRANKVPVAEENIQQWAIAKLSRHGLTPQQVDVTWYRTLRIPGRRASYPVATIQATGTVTDPDTYHHSKTTANQLGKGKAYGLGTIREHEK